MAGVKVSSGLQLSGSKL